MLNGTIYVITNLNNDKKYVGLTRKTAEQRFEEHIEGALIHGADNILSRAIRKHGKENFKVEVLETGIDNADDLKEREKYWIKELDTHAFTGGHGYNMTIGGDGAVGIRRSKETRRRMSKAVPGEKNPMAKAIILIFPDGSEKEFGSIIQATSYLEGRIGEKSYGAIYSLANGWAPTKRSKWYGYSARYKEEFKRKQKINTESFILTSPNHPPKYFNSPYQASEWLSKHLQIPFGIADGYIITLLEGQEPHSYKKYRRILSQYSVQCASGQETV